MFLCSSFMGRNQIHNTLNSRALKFTPKEINCVILLFLNRPIFIPTNTSFVTVFINSVWSSSCYEMVDKRFMIDNKRSVTLSLVDLSSVCNCKYDSYSLISCSCSWPRTRNLRCCSCTSIIAEVLIVVRDCLVAFAVAVDAVGVIFWHYRNIPIVAIVRVIF